MRFKSAITLGLVSLLLLVAADAKPLLYFPTRGFSIAPLEAPDGNSPGVLMTMDLPATDGFAPNVNVLSQASPGDVDAYIAESKQGVEKAGLTITNIQKIGKDAVTCEMTGELRGHKIHCYSKAVCRSNEVILATGTSTEDQWTKVSPLLIKCVDSFSCDERK